MEKQTLTAEELQRLRDLQENNRRLVQELGEISLLEINIRNRKESAESFLTELRKAEQEFSSLLSEKYGDGTLDVNTGEFTPAPSATK